MSASLVGSEMCIRDRASPAPVVAEVASPPPPMAGGAGVEAPSGPAEATVCLLYTSDAADDM
eukprot:11077257-Alexandrium_andersonii.AAC.1